MNQAQHIEHIRRAIAYALWNAADDGRDPLELMGDSQFLGNVTGRFLALEITEGRIPTEAPPVNPSPSRGTFIRQGVES